MDNLELTSYEINTETLLILPYDKNKSKVFEIDCEFIVDLTPLTIIKNSCLYFGCSYEGRRDGTKSIIGVDMKVPIIIEESKCIIFFPTSSCINNNSVWISYQNLLKFSKKNKFSTILYFRENIIIEVDVKYNLIDNQIIRCIKLDSLLNKRRNFISSESINISDDYFL